VRIHDMYVCMLKRQDAIEWPKINSPRCIDNPNPVPSSKQAVVSVLIHDNGRHQRQPQHSSQQRPEAACSFVLDLDDNASVTHPMPMVQLARKLHETESMRHRRPTTDR
jgi:hypothetical protein